MTKILFTSSSSMSYSALLSWSSSKLPFSWSPYMSRKVLSSHLFRPKSSKPTTRSMLKIYFRMPYTSSGFSECPPLTVFKAKPSISWFTFRFGDLNSAIHPLLLSKSNSVLARVQYPKPLTGSNFFYCLHQTRSIVLYLKPHFSISFRMLGNLGPLVHNSRILLVSLYNWMGSFSSFFMLVVLYGIVDVWNLG